MPKKKADMSQKTAESRPPLTPEAAESRNISLAMELAEKQLREGTASSQVITHFLKLGTVKEQLELEKMKKENALLEAKTKSIESSRKMEEDYQEVIKAMRIYSGMGEEYEDI